MYLQAKDEIASRDEEIAMADATLDEIQAQLAQRMLVAGESEMRMNELQAQLADSQKQIDAYRQGQIDMGDESARRNVELEGALREREEQLSVQATHVQSLQAAIEEQKNSYEMLQQKEIELKQHVDEMRDTIARLTEEAHSAEARFASDEEKLKLLQHELQIEAGHAAESDAALEETRTALKEAHQVADSLRETTSEQLLRIENLNSEVSAAHESPKEQLSKAWDRITELSSQLTDANHKAIEAKSELEQLALRERESSGRVSELQGEVDSLRTDYKATLGDLEALRTKETQDEASAQLQQLEQVREVEALKQQLEEKEEDLADLKGTLETVEQLLEEEQQKVAVEQDKLAQLTEEMTEANAASSSSKADLLSKVEALEESVASLTRENSEMTMEIEDSRLRIQDLEEDVQRLERELQAAMDDKDAQSIDFEREKSTRIDDFAKLNERLEQAEKQALDMSTDGAKAFARSSKTIAYLESECARLASLADHHKSVNIKLADDIRSMQEEGLRASGLEHRLKISDESEQQLRSELDKTLVSLTAKEAELLKYMEETQMIEMKRSEDVEKKLDALNERFKDTYDKHQSALKEIKTLKDTNDLAERNMMAEIGALRNELSSAETELQAKMRQLEDSEAMVKSLRSSLLDKDDYISETQSKLGLLRQDADYTKDALERRTIELQSELQEKVDQNCELENKLSSLKGQLADSETINIKKDESIATFLSKQAEMTEKNRELQSDIELKDCEINNLTAILEDTRKDLDEATERADSLQDEFDELQNDTHRKTLSDLAGVEAKLQFLQEEHRELDGQKQALASAKNDAEERCITSDAKCQALQESLATTDGKLHGAIANVNRLESENKQLLTQLEEITTKFSFTSQELSKMQSHLTESTNARESTDKRLHAVETRLEAAEKQIHAYESNEAHMLADMRVIGDVLSNDVDLKAHADGINTVSDFFTSPAASILSAASGVLSTPGVSRINSSASDEATTPGPLSIIQKHLVDVKSKANALAQINLSNEEKLKASKVEIASLKESLDRKSTETAALSLEKENFSARVSTLESDIANLRDSGYHMAQEREELFASADGFAQTVRGILRSLDGKIADSLARANAITAGRMTIKPDEEGALVEVSDDRVSPVDFGASSLLTSSASKVENAMASLCQALEMLVEDITVKKVALDETNARIHANEHASSSERQVLTDKINALEIRCNEEHTRYKESHSEMVKVRQELQSAKDSLGELAGSNADLELEYKHALDSNDDLQGLANRIEGDLHDLQSKLRAEKMDNDRKADEITQLSEHLQLARRKASEIELQLLRKDDVIERSKVEKDAIDSVRRSLEQELDRCRVDLQNQKAIARSAEEDKRASFEVEKLMAALSTTLDQVSASFTYGGSPPPNGSTGQHLEVTSTPLSDRVDMAIRRLGDLRGLCREEGRNRRAQEERIASLEVDLRDSAELADEVQAQFTQLQQGVSERENSWRLKIKDTEELHSTATRRQDEIHRLKSEVDELTDSLDEEKHYKQKLVSELQSKETELVHSRATLESANSNAAKLQEAVDGSRERLREKTMEVESISEQLRASKANNARLAATIDVLERGFDKEKAERDALSLRLKDAGSSSAEVHRLKQQVSNLQGDLEALKEKVKSATHAKHSSESKCAALEHEADTANMRLRSTETRLENLQRENRTLSEEVTHMRHKLTKANEYGDTEHAKYLRAEAALEAMSENVKPEIDNYTAIVNDVQAKLRMDDEDKNNLRNQLHTLKLAADQKDSQIGSLNSKTTSLEKEVHLVREKLQKARDEEEVAKNRSRALRHEGRRARSCILEAVTHMWEVTNTARTEARSAGVEIPSMLNHDSAVALKVSNTNESISETVGLEEALGVSELSKAVEAMREISQWIRDAPRSRIEMESSIKRLEIENTRLVKDITNTETKCEERVSRMRDEVNQLNKELGEFRRGEASHTQLTRHIANLEQTVKTERADKAKACGHADRLQDEVSNLTHELTLTKRELSSLKSAPQVKAGSSSDLSTLQKEMEVLRRETSTQAKEIKAVNHHRSVLRETVDGVEKQLRQMTDALADSQSMQRQLTGSENHELYDKSDEEESLRRMVSRYRARSLAMEELVAIYRAGILALYADGSSYGAANHAWTDDAQQDGLGVGWIEREINTVRRSYDEEVRILEAEVNELRGKLRQSNSFVTELRRRFEDNMRAMYRAGRDQGSEGLLTQFEHVSAALESSEAELDSLNQDLLYEKNQGRRRHTHLVSDLTKALQARDAAFAAVQRLETMCEEAGLGPLNVYEVRS
jgi:chromosome segregation ATPase